MKQDNLRRPYFLLSFRKTIKENPALAIAGERGMEPVPTRAKACSSFRILMLCASQTVFETVRLTLFLSLFEKYTE